MEVIDEKDFQTYIRNEVQNDPQFGNIEESKESKKMVLAGGRQNLWDNNG